MNEPHIWWYITRASALIAWALMTLSVVWGILLSTRVMRRIDNPAWLQDLHRYLGGMTLVMVALHMVTLMLDGWLQFSLAETLVPFATDFKALPVALGILAFYLLVAVQGSSLMMNRLPRRFWKGLHYSSYAALVLVSMHAGWTGTDVSAWWYRVLAIVLISVATISVIVRIITSTRTPSRPAIAAATKKPVVTSSATTPVATRPTSRTMVVARVEPAAEGVLSIRLLPLGGGQLPVWQPGAHITLHLPSGLERQYSLCGDPAERTHFDIAVLKTANSEGGSEWIHSSMSPGMTLEVTGPLNHFELEPASEYLFIAGGIGITPIKAMIESLPERRQWKLMYAGRSQATMAFRDELVERYPERVVTYASDEATQPLDIYAAVAGSTAQVYCCGPESLMSAVASFVPAERMHCERFVPLVRESRAPAEDITVNCRKSKKSFVVPAEGNILESLEQNGLPVLGSCRKGVCGSCEVRVVEGHPVHLDSVMDDAEKEKLRIMYPCVSRAEGTQLTLDI
ncbi:ferredoxin-NADP reductase/DMSO/TMAO reductase YedYZ heme-binding membrane subunit [Aurantimicrobium minutum]|uniref:2Fe-2S iron-sulfur cluster-binding protein n=1 Tax=Aurantimicrobium minutum TaxID=708131 RepID=UPI002476B869|nr:2Fe-2S iron-sulfur cluster-binding protein [Aurantimicrobium minutum]MDH6532092.1 ferredoxin-NADP reductase/DMSO/TMAO reductase YedYZ heme-binding membrane subunit [Aurantimicrobium minutum]